VPPDGLLVPRKLVMSFVVPPPSSLAAPGLFLYWQSFLCAKIKKTLRCPCLARLLTPSVRLCHAFCGKTKGKKPAKASVQAPLPVSLLTSAFTCQASVVLADGSRLSRASPQTAPFLRFLQPVPSVLAAGAFSFIPD
jgi:hypothetical protein